MNERRANKKEIIFTSAKHFGDTSYNKIISKLCQITKLNPSLHCRCPSLLLIHVGVFLLVTVSVCKKRKTDLGGCFIQIFPSVVARSQKQSLMSFRRCKDWLWVSFFLCMQSHSFLTETCIQTELCFSIKQRENCTFTGP